MVKKSTKSTEAKQLLVQLFQMAAQSYSHHSQFHQENTIHEVEYFVDCILQAAQQETQKLINKNKQETQQQIQSAVNKARNNNSTPNTRKVLERANNFINRINNNQSLSQALRNEAKEISNDIDSLIKK